MRFELETTRKGEPFADSFIGSIDKLAEVQDDSLDKVFIQLAILPVVGIGIQKDRFEVKTLTTLPREDRIIADRDTDGNAVMETWLRYVFVRFPNRTCFTPFADWGYGDYDNKFNPDPWWYDNGFREFILEDSRGTFVAGGVDIALRERLSLTLYGRRTELDVDGTYYFQGDDRDPEPFTFPMSHSAYGVGLYCRF